MNKTQYFVRSKELQLLPRCPLVGYCMRWAATVYVYSYSTEDHHGLNPIQVLDKYGELPSDFESDKIPLSTDDLGWIRNDSDGILRCDNMCPEVALFDRLNRPSALTESAISSFFYEKRAGLSSVEYKHFSECLEYIRGSQKQRQSAFPPELNDSRAQFQQDHPYPQRVAFLIKSYKGISVMKKIALWGSLASILGLAVALFSFSASSENTTINNNGSKNPVFTNPTGDVNINYNENNNENKRGYVLRNVQGGQPPLLVSPKLSYIMDTSKYVCTPIIGEKIQPLHEKATEGGYEIWRKIMVLEGDCEGQQGWVLTNDISIE